MPSLSRNEKFRESVGELLFCSGELRLLLGTQALQTALCVPWGTLNFGTNDTLPSSPEINTKYSKQVGKQYQIGVTIIILNVLLKVFFFKATRFHLHELSFVLFSCSSKALQ